MVLIWDVVIFMQLWAMEKLFMRGLNVRVKYS